MKDLKQQALPELTLLPEDSPAKTCQSPESKQESRESVQDYLMKSYALLASYDLDTSSSKTLPPYSQDQTPMNTQTTDAYAAGLIDGEGCIGIESKQGKSYQVRVDVGMTVKAAEVLKFMQDNYGGKVRQTRKQNEKWEAAYAWMVSGKKARPFLERIMPYLVLKKEQAELAMRLYQMMDDLPKLANGYCRWTEQAKKDGATIKALMQELNQKGPSVTREAGWFARYVGGQWITPQADMFNPTGHHMYSEGLPKSGLMRNGTLYRLAPLAELSVQAHHTEGSGSGLWLTPTTSESKTDPVKFKKRMEKYRNGTTVPNLATQVENRSMWPAPNASDNRDRGNLSTPAIKRRMEKGKQINLSMSVSHESGQLNPTWVSLLMGLPPTWCDLEDE